MIGVRSSWPTRPISCWRCAARSNSASWASSSWRARRRSRSRASVISSITTGVTSGDSIAPPLAASRTACTIASASEPFRTYPVAPATSMSRTERCSSMLLRAITPTLGLAAFRRRVASMPSISGIRMSISTTSGARRRTISIASVPEHAWPITSSSSPLSRNTKDSRKPSLSSTTSTRMRSGTPRGWVALTGEASARIPGRAIRPMPGSWGTAVSARWPTCRREAARLHGRGHPCWYPRSRCDRRAGASARAGVAIRIVEVARDRRRQPTWRRGRSRAPGRRNVPSADSTSPGAREPPLRGPSCSTIQLFRPWADAGHGHVPWCTRPSHNARGVIQPMDQDTTPATPAAPHLHLIRGPAAANLHVGQGPGEAQGRAGGAGCEARSAGARSRAAPPPRPAARTAATTDVAPDVVKPEPAASPTPASRPSSGDGEAREPGTGAPRRRRSRGGRGRGTGSRPATATDVPTERTGTPTEREPEARPEQAAMPKPPAATTPKPAQRQPKAAAPTDGGEPDQRHGQRSRRRERVDRPEEAASSPGRPGSRRQEAHDRRRRRRRRPRR